MGVKCAVKLLVFFLVFYCSASALAATVCPDNKHCFLDLQSKKSVYQDGDKCTQPLLSDGVCPDYLVGGCAQSGNCQTQDNEKKLKKHR